MNIRRIAAATLIAGATVLASTACVPDRLAPYVKSGSSDFGSSILDDKGGDKEPPVNEDPANETQTGD